VRNEEGDYISEPLVTIGLPVYNGASTLRVAVESILQQTYQNWELILLDDASSDESSAVMHSFHDSRIRLVEGDKNLGLSARLNMAIDMAKGEYFARMDQDDISFPNRIKKQVCYLQVHSEIDLLSSNVLVFKDDGIILGKWPMINGAHAYICRHPCSGFYMAHPTWVGKLQWFRKYYYCSDADGAEDQHLLYRSYKNSRFACLCEPLLGYRESRTLKKMLRARWVVLREIGRLAYTRRDYVDLITILLVQTIKLCGDIMTYGLGIGSLRNPLLSIDGATRLLWVELWNALSLPSGTNK